MADGGDCTAEGLQLTSSIYFINILPNIHRKFLAEILTFYLRFAIIKANLALLWHGQININNSNKERGKRLWQQSI